MALKLLSPQQRRKVHAIHTFRHRNAEHAQDCRRLVLSGHQFLRPAGLQAAAADQKGNSDGALIPDVLCHQLMIPHHIPVVRRDHDPGLFIQPVLLQPGNHSADVLINACNRRVILACRLRHIQPFRDRIPRILRRRGPGDALSLHPGIQLLIFFRDQVIGRVRRIVGYEQGKFFLSVFFQKIKRHIGLMFRRPFSDLDIISFRIPIVWMQMIIISAIGIPEIKAVPFLSRRRIGIPASPSVRLVQMPFSDISGGVPLPLQYIRNTERILLQVRIHIRLAVRKYVGGSRLSARQQAGPVRRTQRAGAVSPVKYHALCGQPVQIRRYDLRIIKPPGVPPPLIRKQINQVHLSPFRRPTGSFSFRQNCPVFCLYYNRTGGEGIVTIILLIVTFYINATIYPSAGPG